MFPSFDSKIDCLTVDALDRILQNQVGKECSYLNVPLFYNSELEHDVKKQNAFRFGPMNLNFSHSLKSLSNIFNTMMINFKDKL